MISRFQDYSVPKIEFSKKLYPTLQSFGAAVVANE